MTPVKEDKWRIKNGYHLGIDWKNRRKSQGCRLILDSSQSFSCSHPCECRKDPAATTSLFANISLLFLPPLPPVRMRGINKVGFERGRSSLQAHIRCRTVQHVARDRCALSDLSARPQNAEFILLTSSALSSWRLLLIS